ncbi:hypothetical protein CABS01_12918 [Colletotrichum abscissum]|uniref:uncharacterized protein n=1 Tax=Colletotrichum abscissum TaxID=1671311 RepID=UPI0027D5D71A|nr:uncharacterized protein CABS01_12918 [Colletotrichum abscissum]KAK1487439.1 hypothetical protein CABS01_12918 [Colletotrichum abscissum]
MYTLYDIESHQIYARPAPVETDQSQTRDAQTKAEVKKRGGVCWPNTPRQAFPRWFFHKGYKGQQGPVPHLSVSRLSRSTSLASCSRLPRLYLFFALSFSSICVRWLSRLRLIQIQARTTGFDFSYTFPGLTFRNSVNPIALCLRKR